MRLRRASRRHRLPVRRAAVAANANSPPGKPAASGIGVGWLLALALLALAGCKSVPVQNLATEVPSNDRDWSPDMAVLPYADFRGHLVDVHNVRNCHYLSEQEYVLDWYDKTYDLEQIQSVDFMMIPFPEQPQLAHTMLSFGFARDQYLCVSVETRREKGEVYDPLQGLVNQYEIMYVVGDERDLVKLRANYRKNQVYLYRTKATPAQARALFVDVMARVNQLRDHPEFYNTITNNCTTNVQRHINRLKPGAVPFSRDVLLHGTADRYVYNLGLLDTRLPFDQAKEAAHVNALSEQHGESAHYSALIRQRTLAQSGTPARR